MSAGGSRPRRVACPRCGEKVDWAPSSPYRPFCSERCKLIDLGAWATGKYRVAGEDASPEQPPEH